MRLVLRSFLFFCVSLTGSPVFASTIYFSTASNPSLIESVNTDGSGAAIVIGAAPFSSLRHLAIDSGNARVFYTGAGGPTNGTGEGSIWSANLDGTAAQTL